MWSDEQIAARVAADLEDGTYVNLGIGLPLRVAELIPPGIEVLLQSENGVLGVGASPTPGEEDWDCIDAGKRPITLEKGGCYFDHATSFAMIRGSHIDVTILGAFEVSQRGDLANWTTGDSDVIPGVGGAMDLAVGAKQVLIIMHNQTRDGFPRMRKRCALPITAAGTVTRVYTELCVAEPKGDFFQVVELAPGVTRDDIVKSIEGEVAFC